MTSYLLGMSYTSLLKIDVDIDCDRLIAQNRSIEHTGSSVGDPKDKGIQPANGIVDFLLGLGIVIAGFITANSRSSSWLKTALALPV